MWDTFPHFCACLSSFASRVDIVVSGNKVNVPVLRAANCSTSSAGLWWLTAEVLERCKVQRGRVWSGLGDPAHVSLLMLSRGEVDTRPTGVTVPPPKASESPWKWGRDLDLLGSFSPAFPLFLSYFAWPSTQLRHTTPTLMWLTLLIFVISAWIQ